MSCPGFFTGGPRHVFELRGRRNVPSLRFVVNASFPHCTSVADDVGTPHLCGLTLCFFEAQNRAVIVLAAALHCY